MPTYKVICNEVTQLTYSIEADSPKAALERFEQQFEAGQLQPEEDLIGTDGVEALLDESGRDVLAEGRAGIWTCSFCKREL